MLLYPAIDLMGGQVVRLRQGKAEEKTVYSKDPVSFAQRWQAEGGDWLHVVDLDGAFTGSPCNREVVRAMARAVSIPIQMGGGLRELREIEATLTLGVHRVILGSRACQDPAFVGECVRAFGSERIAVGIDARDGKVAVHGWTKTGSMDALELAQQVEAEGASAIIYTDIAKDGMLQGPNFEALEAMVNRVKVKVIASGGVSSLEDVQRLKKLERLHGAILGKALYEGKLNLQLCR